MKRVRVKICGLTRNEDLETAIEAGADAVGFIVDVPSSPRNLTLKEAERMIKKTPIFVSTVTVTVLRDLERLTKICEKLRPDSLQIHGDNFIDIEIREGLPKVSLTRAIQVKSDRVIPSAVETAKVFDAILLDKRVREAIHPRPLIIAGGLNHKNVEEAIRIVQPYAVDVSSGVEKRPGIKDRRKVFEFVKNVREAST
jgi:phosphoribosylanthranilate isomerase